MAIFLEKNVWRHPHRSVTFGVRPLLRNSRFLLHELLQRGLEAANHIILEQQRTDTLHFVDGVASLVQIGIRNDPNLTISFLQSLSPSDTKAALLLEAAWALSKRQSIPVG